MAEAVLWLNRLGTGDISRAGGKLARLGALSAAGFDVPRGFALPVDSLAPLLPAELADQIAADVAAAGDEMSAIEATAGAARAAIEAVDVPEGLRAAIADAYAELGSDVRTAVRSSGVSEDGEAASFAGQFDTYLGIQGTDAVVAAVRRCFASQFTARALDYGRRNGLPAGANGMAVGVLEMVQARAAGIAMTVDPIAKRDDRVVVEASFGLGEAIVSGQVTPDRWVIDKATLAIVDQRPAVKEVWSAFDAEAGEVVLQPMPDELRERPSLSIADVQQVVASALRIEEREGSAQDVEWALTSPDNGNRLVLLQHRPETTMAAASAPFDPVAYTMRNVLGVKGTGS